MFFEEMFLNDQINCLIGIDEVGRGPLAGPVVVAGVLLETENCDWKNILTTLDDFGVTDSKKLTDKKRHLILEQLGIVPRIESVMEICEGLHFFICSLDHDEIDKINILNATLKAMEMVFEKLVTQNCIALIDGNKVPRGIGTSGVAIVKGDSKSSLIGLASIIAKVYRDNLMKEFDQVFPGYQFSKHVGYPTALHLEAIRQLGPCMIHRKTFKGVKEHYE